MDDLSVIARIRDGDTQAFEVLVHRYQGPLFNYLGRMSPNSNIVEDLVQDAFVRAFRHLSTFDPDRARFSTWLFTIARHVGLNALSRRLPTANHGEMDSIPDCAADLAEQYRQAEIQKRISIALAQLPPKYRSPVALLYLGDLSIAEIAQIEGCAAGTVKSRIHRGKRKMMALLADLVGEAND